MKTVILSLQPEKDAEILANAYGVESLLMVVEHPEKGIGVAAHSRLHCTKTGRPFFAKTVATTVSELVRSLDLFAQDVTAVVIKTLRSNESSNTKK